MVEELENVPTLTPKKPRIQEQQSEKVACAGYVYGQYVQESLRLDNPPLDFITFEAALLGDVELRYAEHNFEQHMPEVRAIEGTVHMHCFTVALDLPYIQRSSSSLHQRFLQPRRSPNSNQPSTSLRPHCQTSNAHHQIKQSNSPSSSTDYS